MLGETFEQIPCQIEPDMLRIRAFQPHDGAQGMSVVAKTAEWLHRLFQCIFARMAERWVAKIMRKAKRLSQVFIEAQGARDDPANLRDFQTVSHARAIMIAFRRDEDLRLGAQTTKTHRMNDSITVALKLGSRPPCRPSAASELAPARSFRISSKGRRHHHAAAITKAMRNGQREQSLNMKRKRGFPGFQEENGRPIVFDSGGQHWVSNVDPKARRKLETA